MPVLPVLLLCDGFGFPGVDGTDLVTRPLITPDCDGPPARKSAFVMIMPEVAVSILTGRHGYKSPHKLIKVQMDGRFGVEIDLRKVSCLRGVTS